MERQCRLMQSALDKIAEWGVDWQMVFAPGKSQYIVFRHPNKVNYPRMKFKLNGGVIKETESVKYLGLIMDKHLSYEEHINYILGKSMRKLGYLTYLCAYKGIRPSMSAYMLIYNAVIRPSLEYACAFWNCAAEAHKKKLERVQRLAICRILGVMKATSYETCNMMAQIPPLELRRRQEEIKLFHKCVKYSVRAPEHNLIKAYMYWKENCTDFTGKLSTLSRARIHARDARVPAVGDRSERSEGGDQTRVCA